jgi:hypothetical protein
MRRIVQFSSAKAWAKWSGGKSNAIATIGTSRVVIASIAA